MKRMGAKIKRNKFFLVSVMSILTLILITGIQYAYAYYYNESDSLPIFSNLVGDFDSGNGDINIVIYKETKVKSDEFVKTYVVPAVGYSFNMDRTSCKAPSGQKITCKKDDPTSACNYTFDEKTKEFSLTSNQKVTCQFYFNKDYENDIELYVMIQDENGTHTHGQKKYRNVDDIPAFGFTYNNDYECENGSTVEVDPETGKIKVLAEQRDVCYVYYDGDLKAADIIANVYIQKTVGGLYTKVSSIPSAQKYVISQNEKSYCHTFDGRETGIVPTYENGSINISEAEEKQICEVYLDIDTSSN